MIYQNHPLGMTENHDFRNFLPLMYSKLEKGKMFIFWPEKYNTFFIADIETSKLLTIQRGVGHFQHLLVLSFSKNSVRIKSDAEIRMVRGF